MESTKSTAGTSTTGSLVLVAAAAVVLGTKTFVTGLLGFLITATVAVASGSSSTPLSPRGGSTKSKRMLPTFTSPVPATGWALPDEDGNGEHYEHLKQEIAAFVGHHFDNSPIIAKTVAKLGLHKLIPLWRPYCPKQDNLMAIAAFFVAMWIADDLADVEEPDVNVLTLYWYTYCHIPRMINELYQADKTKYSTAESLCQAALQQYAAIAPNGSHPFLKGHNTLLALSTAHCRLLAANDAVYDKFAGEWTLAADHVLSPTIATERRADMLRKIQSQELSLHELLKYRTLNGGVSATLWIMLAGSGAAMTPSAVNRADIAALIHHVAVHICLTNDLVSYAKDVAEYGTGTPMCALQNCVEFQLRHCGDCHQSLEQAQARTIHECNVAVDRFQSLARQIEFEDSDGQFFVKLGERMIVGHMRWIQQSERYGHKDIITAAFED